MLADGLAPSSVRGLSPENKAESDRTQCPPLPSRGLHTYIHMYLQHIHAYTYIHTSTFTHTHRYLHVFTQKHRHTKVRWGFVWTAEVIVRVSSAADVHD